MLTMMRFWTKLSRFIAAVTQRVSATTLEFYLISLTNDPVLELLVFPDRIAIALALMLFTVEILDRLIVE